MYLGKFSNENIKETKHKFNEGHSLLIQWCLHLHDSSQRSHHQTTLSSDRSLYTQKYEHTY